MHVTPVTDNKQKTVIDMSQFHTPHDHDGIEGMQSVYACETDDRQQTENCYSSVTISEEKYQDGLGGEHFVHARYTSASLLIHIFDSCFPAS